MLYNNIERTKEITMENTKIQQGIKVIKGTKLNPENLRLKNEIKRMERYIIDINTHINDTTSKLERLINTSDILENCSNDDGMDLINIVQSMKEVKEA